jgi:hypothetical protein
MNEDKVECPKHGKEFMVSKGFSNRDGICFELYQCCKCDYFTDRKVTWNDFNREWA